MALVKFSLFDDGWMVLLLGLAIGIGVGYIISRYQPPAPQTASLPAYQNEETWNWTDWKGRQRSITVHRNVKRYVPA